MAMQSVQDLFQFELSGMYDAEQRIMQMLPQMANEVNNDQVKSTLQMHQQQTQQQIKNLEQCFQVLGMQPGRVTCQTIEGLKQERDSFVKQNPQQNILTMFDLGGAAKTEHFEIASYRGLVEKANLMGQKDCARLLQENLSQEEAMAQKVEQMSRQIGQQMVQGSGQQKQKV